MAYDVVIMTCASDNAKDQFACYQAILTFPGGFAQGMRAGNLAARGPVSESVIKALEGLLHVTAAALEKYQGNVMKEAQAPIEVAAGYIDGHLLFGKSPWKNIFSNETKN